MLEKLRQILQMIRFSHTLFALPFAVLSAGMATRLELRDGRAWRLLDWLGMLLCMVTARSAAMAFNRLADRKLDAENPRTAMRHLPAGLLTSGSVWAFTLVCAVGFVASTGLFWWSSGNRLPLYLSGPVLLFLCFYSFTKRFTALSHFWLGGALMLAPVSAWIAIRGGLDWPPMVLGGAVLFWVAGFDILYACQDMEYDRKVGLNSVPARLGVERSLRVAMLCHAGMVAWLVLLPAVFELGWIYAAGVAAVAALLLFEHFLVRADDLTRVNLAFFHVNSVVSVGLLLVTVLDMVAN